uniref:Histidine N-acetyltransferase C-terminal domain-containing protein n=1 Tax=Leptobrachium leishanense TaxID=445787 RepID=A0A8C5M7D9_9ANUR
FRWLIGPPAPFDGVIAISEGVFMGIDYLPFRYHAWLKDPQRRMFVVAFDSFLVVDGGVTAVLQGLRVAPWLRGRGVAGIIQKFTLDTLRLDHPDVTKIRLTRTEDPPPTMLNKYRLLHSKVNSISNMSNRLSRLPSTSQDFPPPVFLDYSEVRSLFSGPLKEEDILPGRFLIQSWLPITTCKANLDLTQRWRVQCLGTPMFPVPLGDGKNRLDIDLFGTDLSCAKIHVVFQLKEAVKALPTGGSVVCSVFAEEILRDGLTGFLDGITLFSRCREQLVLEMDIKPVKTPPSTQCHS